MTVISVIATNYLLENCNPATETPLVNQVPPVQPIIVITLPAVHVAAQVEDHMYHTAPSENPDVYERMDEFHDQFHDLQKDLKAMKGKNLFGKKAYDLCFVPNVTIPVKLKVLNFEKYKGNSCPQSHLTMYCRKMATHTDDDKLLIHYFQDNLTGATLKWYMGLDNAYINYFNNLVEEFMRQYKYNLDMAPDRDQLCAMS